jgi:hypothetical protein
MIKGGITCSWNVWIVKSNQITQKVKDKITKCSVCVWRVSTVQLHPRSSKLSVCTSDVNLYLRVTLVTQTRGKTGKFIQQNVLLGDFTFVYSGSHIFQYQYSLEIWWVPVYLCAMTVCEWVTPRSHGYDGIRNSLYFWLGTRWGGKNNLYTWSSTCSLWSKLQQKKLISM